jgi:hypothetical protein
MMLKTRKFTGKRCETRIAEGAARNISRMVDSDRAPSADHKLLGVHGFK